MNKITISCVLLCILFGCTLNVDTQLANAQLRIGMYPYEVRALMGEPSDIDHNVFQIYTGETIRLMSWTYYGFASNSETLVVDFKNDQVEGWNTF